MHPCRCLAGILLCAVTIGPAHAGWTAHLGVGPSRVTGDGNALGLQNEAVNDDNFGYTAGAGYRLSRHWMFDLSYYRINTASSAEDALVDIFTYGETLGDRAPDLRGSGIRWISEGYLPLGAGDGFGPFVRLGYWWWDVRIGTEEARRSHSGDDPMAGIGFRFGHFEDVYLDIGIDRHRIADHDLDLRYFQLGVAF